jgi:hypothetical protein
MRSFHVARSFHDKAAGAVRTRLAELAHRRYLASDGASGPTNAAAQAREVWEMVQKLRGIADGA